MKRTTPIKPASIDIESDPGLTSFSPKVTQPVILPTGNTTTGTASSTTTHSIQIIKNIYQINAPMGANGEVQFNEGGSYVGDAGLTYNPTTDTLTTGTLYVNNLYPTRVNFTSISNITIGGGSYNNVLKTDGAGTLSWDSAFPSDAGNTGKFLKSNGINQEWANVSYANLVDVPANIATQSYVGNAIANLVDSSPAALNTLNELANALGNNASFSTTITNQLANKADVSYVTWANVSGKPTFVSNLDSLSDVSVSSPSSGQVLKFNGTSWINDADSTSGTSYDQDLNTSNNVAFNQVTTSSVTGQPLGNGGAWNSTVVSISIGTSTVVDLTGSVFPGPVTGKIRISGVIGTTEINGLWWYQATNEDQFEIFADESLMTSVDSTAWNVYTSGGVVVTVQNLILNVDSNAWTFDTNGNITLPTNSSRINYANGTSILSGITGGGGGGIALTDISIGAPNSASGGGGLSYVNTTGVFTYTPPVIPTSFSNLVNGAHIVSLGSDGNLTLPEGTILSETANSTTITPPNALAGQGLVVRLTGVQGIVSDHPGGFTDGDTITITVTPDYSSASVTGTVDYTFTGATSVQLGRALTGTLTFTSESFREITWTIPVSSTMTTFTITLSNASGFSIAGLSPLTLTTSGSTEDHHIHLIAGDPSITDIYLGDDDQYVKIERNGGNVLIGTNTNTKQWTFGTDGQLTVPGAIRKDGGLYMNSGGNGISSTVFVNGTAGSVILRTDNGISSKSLTLDVAGDVTLPGTLNYPNDALQQDSALVTCPGNASTVVYIASADIQHTIKLLIQVEGLVDAETLPDTQSCEMIIAKSFRGNNIASTVYAIVHTSIAPLATFTALWDGTINRVEVICTPTGANGVDVKTFATEITAVVT